MLNKPGFVACISRPVLGRNSNPKIPEFKLGSRTWHNFELLEPQTSRTSNTRSSIQDKNSAFKLLYPVFFNFIATDAFKRM